LRCPIGNATTGGDLHRNSWPIACVHFLVDTTHMAAKKKPQAHVKKPVQISFDPQILRQVDANREAKKAGRSAFVMQAILTYLRMQREKDLEEQVRQAYKGQADKLLGELEPYLPHQVWSDDDVETIPAAPPVRA